MIVRTVSQMQQLSPRNFEEGQQFRVMSGEGASLPSPLKCVFVTVLNDGTENKWSIVNSAFINESFGLSGHIQVGYDIETNSIVPVITHKNFVVLGDDDVHFQITGGDIRMGYVTQSNYLQLTEAQIKYHGQGEQNPMLTIDKAENEIILSTELGTSFAKNIKLKGRLLEIGDVDGVSSGVKLSIDLQSGTAKKTINGVESDL